MSDEAILNPPSETVERAPTADYAPMPDYSAPEPEKKKTYDGEEHSLREAAKDLDKARAEGGVPKAEDEPIDRGYQYLTGDKVGQPVEDNLTLDPRRAARDLSHARELDIAAQSPTVGEVAGVIDQVRAAYNGQQQQQPQVEQQPQQQEQPQQAVDGIDPEIAAAINNPKIRAALEQEIATVEQARGQYAQAALQASQLAAAAALAAFPELQSLSAAEMPVALRLIAAKDPGRAQAIQAHMQRTNQLWQASQQAKAQQEQLQAQRIQAFAQEQDAIFEREVASKETPEMMHKIGQTVVEMAEEYGVSKQDLAQLWHSHPLMRAAPFQRMMADAARYRMAQRDVANKLDRSTPPVQRPGVSQPRGDDGDVAAAMKQFSADPNPKNAAALLMARRAARSR